jgi:type II secretory pathway component PulF
MSRFKCRGRRGNGDQVIEVVEAESAAAAAKRLTGMGIIPVQIAPETAGADVVKPHDEDEGESAGGGLLGDRVKTTDVIMFTRQLVTLYKAGLPFLSSLDAIANQTTNPALERVIADVRTDVEGGKALSAALAKHPKVFPEVYVATVMAGEAGGVLDQVMDRLVALMENEQETKQTIKAAMRYPVMVVGAMLVAFLVIVTFVIPTFSKLFSKMGADLPTPTKIMVAINGIRQNYWHVTLVGVAAAVAGFIYYVRTPSGRLNFDRLTLKCPLIGPIIMQASMARLAHMFGTLSQSGLPILKELGVIARTIGNKQIALELEAARDAVQEGSNLGTAIETATQFPPLVRHMVAVGEKTGAMGEMMQAVADHYDRETKVAIGKLTQAIEPLITVVLGAGLLFLALAVFLPMWDMMRVMQQGGG